LPPGEYTARSSRVLAQFLLAVAVRGISSRSDSSMLISANTWCIVASAQPSAPQIQPASAH
jgi:hypothetical protein